MKKTYDATDDVVNYILHLMDEFYASLGEDDEGYFLLFFKVIMRKVLKEWKVRVKRRHPFDFNQKMSECTDVSKRNIERINPKM